MSVATKIEKSRAVMVSVDKLNIDASYQRSGYINKSLVRAISHDFDEMLFGILTVGKRSDGTLWVVDGMHRLLGAKDAGKASVLCVIFDSSGAEHEAEVFYNLNTKRTGVNCISVYKALLTQREEVTVAIQRLLEQYGFGIGRNMGQFGAANAIRQSYKAGVLDRVLKVISESFGSGSDRWKWMFGSSHFIQMLTFVYTKYGEFIDDTRMITVLHRMHQDEYQRLASQHAGTTGNRAPRIGPAFVSEYYNCGLRKNRIKV